ILGSFVSTNARLTNAAACGQGKQRSAVHFRQQPSRPEPGRQGAEPGAQAAAPVCWLEACLSAIFLGTRQQRLERVGHHTDGIVSVLANVPAGGGDISGFDESDWAAPYQV